MPQTEDYAICAGSDGRRGRAGSAGLNTNVSNNSKGNTELVGKGNVFLYKHSHFPSFAAVGKSLLKVLLYIYIYICILCTHSHADMHVRVETNMRTCSIVPSIVQAEVVHKLCYVQRMLHGTYCASLTPNTKVLWVCPDLTLPLQQTESALADPTERPLSHLGTFVSSAGRGQQPPHSDPQSLLCRLCPVVKAPEEKHKGSFKSLPSQKLFSKA